MGLDRDDVFVCRGHVRCFSFLSFLECVVYLLLLLYFFFVVFAYLDLSLFD